MTPLLEGQRLVAACAALAMHHPNPVVYEHVAQFMRRVAAIDIERCRQCATGRLHLMALTALLLLSYQCLHRGTPASGPPA